MATEDLTKVSRMLMRMTKAGYKESLLAYFPLSQLLELPGTSNEAHTFVFVIFLCRTYIL